MGALVAFNPVNCMKTTQEKPQPRTYDEKVSANMAHLGTMLGDWSTVAFTGRTIPDPDGGRPAFEQDYSAVQGEGWKHADTLFPNTGTEGVCELCGKSPIKFLFGIKCDKLRLTMSVGSECISRFQKDSGAKSGQKAKAEFNRDSWAYCNAVKKKLGSELCRRSTDTWGRCLEVWSTPNARRIYGELKDALGSINEDSGAAAFTRWNNAKGQVAQKLAEESEGELEKGKPFRITTRKWAVSSMRHEILHGKRVMHSSFQLPEWEIELHQKRIAKLESEILELGGDVE